MHNLSKTVKVVRASNAVAAGAADINCAVVDRQGFNGCLIIAHLGAIVAGAVIALKAQQGDDPAGADAADIAGSRVPAVAATDSNKTLVLDIAKPRERYIRPVVVRGAQNSAVDSVEVILYNASHNSPSPDATLAAQKVLSEPGEGVA